MDNLYTWPNIINLFVALGTCAAVLVALFSKKQSTFESTFYLLLTQHSQALKDLKSSSDYQQVTKKILDGLMPLEHQNKLMHEHDDFYGSYFRILYHIVKYIDENGGITCCSYKKKKLYTSLVRAHLDNELTFLLAINCAHGSKNNQYGRYKELIEKYSLLEHLILNNEILLKYTPPNTSEANAYSRVTTILVTEDLKTIFNDIVSTYKKEAFGTNPDVDKFINKTDA
ncbi:putative phage abortive infection protein [Morganella morganii]|uniref:putative phage abortive infection protein n=1 Tax=Morganella morganii TaxID=582 RepID=UPI001BDB94CB|nr:putative phage abortive infection protein [Morganella morganii]MBT0462327.1 putative phage abortive infection protein [Morganella morganii subsp. morganii]